jgi:hypothetical protein
MMIKNILIIILILCLPITIFAQNDGAANTGLAFLKLGIGARAIAMGDAYSSITNDGTAFVYNPARLNSGKMSNVMLMYNTSMLDMHTSYIGAKIKSNKLGIGFGLIKTGVEGIEVRNIPGDALDKFDSQDLSLGVSLCYEVYKNVSVGITSKMIYEKIYTDETSGVGFDIGTNYSKDNLSVSFVLANLGSVNELKNSTIKLPTSVRFGGAYGFKKDNFNFIIAVDAFKVLDGGNLHINTGGELGFKEIVFLRLGYQTNYDNRGFTSGIGVKYKSFNLDYAFVPYSETFGSSNSFSLGFNF